LKSPGSNIERVPIIFTQYAPRSLKVDDADAPILVNAQGPLPMRVVTDELTDLVTFQEATDLQFVCHSYWVGGKYGVIDQDKYGNLTKGYRYYGLQMFAQLPIMRTRIDFSKSKVDKAGIKGLAGINGNAAAVLLWNTSASSTVSVPLQQVNLPASVASGQTTLTMLDSSSPTPYTLAYIAGQNISLPPNSVALVKTQRSDVTDPLLRRKALGTQVKFLKTETFGDRVPIACDPGEHIPGITRCGKNTGTYGFYDSVRAIAYLGTATTTGVRDPKVLTVYENIPPKIYVNLNIFNSHLTSTLYGTGSVVARLTFPKCSKQTPITLSTETNQQFKQGLGTIDLSALKIPAVCYTNAPTEIMFEAKGLMPGAQTEIYLSSQQTEADMILQSTNQIRN
jgi:hypothetical protein